MKISRKFVIGVLVAAVTILIGSRQGYTDTLSIQLSDGTTTVTCADGAGCDTNGLAGAVTISTTFATATVSVGGTGSGTPALDPLNMDLSYNLTQNSSAPAGTYTIAVSEDNLSATNQQWTTLINGNQKSGYTTQFDAFADAGNVLFTNSTSICTAGPTGSVSVALTCSGPASPFSDASFSLTELITLTTTAGSGNASGDARLTPVPEPASMLLFGFGLFGLALWGRKRLSK